MGIPFSLKITALFVVVLVALLIIVIRKKKRELLLPVIILIILGIGFGVWKGINEYNRKNEDLTFVVADVKISAVDFIHDYEKDEAAANNRYLGKIVEADGNIKKIEKDEKGYYTVILGDPADLSSVRCSMDTVYNEDAAHLGTGSSATLRGMCTGFNKDEIGLGSDVILNRCAVILKR